MKSIVAVTVISLVAAVIVVCFHSFFTPLIAAKQTSEQSAAAKEVIPVRTEIIEVSGKSPLPERYWIGKKDSIVVGYAFPIEGRGYFNSINYIVGVDTAGVVIGMKIISEIETPGWGTRVDKRYSQRSLYKGIFGIKDKNLPWFTGQFTGTNITRPYLIAPPVLKEVMSDADRINRSGRNEISALSGATMSSKAIVRGIEKTAAAYFTAIQGPRQ